MKKNKRHIVLLLLLLLLIAGACRAADPGEAPTAVPTVVVPTSVAEVTPEETASPSPSPTATATATATATTAAPTPPTATATTVPADNTPPIVRIQFPAGATSDTVAGTLVTGQRQQYLFRANAGQTAKVLLSSTGDAASFFVRGVDDGLFHKTPNDPSRQWQATLPRSQDYLLEVSAFQNTSYDLTLTIDPLPAPQVSAIGGVVYQDANGNGAFDSGEAVVPNVQVYLRPHNCDGTGLLAHRVSGANGRYSFADLQPGGYCVSTVGSNGYVDSRPVMLTAGQPQEAVHLRAPQDEPAPTGAIGGVIYVDGNGNGIFDGGEAVAPNVQVYLRPHSCEGNGLLANTVSAADGSYLFADLQAGGYCVDTVGQSGYVDSRPVTLVTGQTQGDVHLRAPQPGGDPMRIQFPAGDTGVAIQGELPSQTQAVYLFRASAGQEATVAVTSAENNILFHLEGVSDGIVYKHLLDGNSSWQGRLGQTQDYRLTLDQVGPGSTYTLELTIVN